MDINFHETVSYRRYDNDNSTRGTQEFWQLNLWHCNLGWDTCMLKNNNYWCTVYNWKLNNNLPMCFCYTCMYFIYERYSSILLKCIFSLRHSIYYSCPDMLVWEGYVTFTYCTLIYVIMYLQHNTVLMDYGSIVHWLNPRFRSLTHKFSLCTVYTGVPVQWYCKGLSVRLVIKWRFYEMYFGANLWKTYD